MPCWIKLKSLFALLLLLTVFPAAAESVRAIRADAVKLPAGQLAVSTRFYLDLPQQLQDALLQGVPLQFDLSYQLTRPSFAAYKFRFNQWFADNNTVSYKLTHHPLTNRYRVTVGTFYTEYQTLDAALKALGAIANWEVLPAGTLNDYAAADIGMSVRLTLSTRQLPKPFQINALTSRDWNLDSGWVALRITGT
ncbi:MAG: DUF4390 domain-containing protein [Neisseria sp.]|nr:DUF4390 domain-containing protein [Neisseria sp.]